MVHAHDPPVSSINDSHRYLHGGATKMTNVRIAVVPAGGNDWHFALHVPDGCLVTGPLSVRHDGLPDLHEVRRRLDDVAEPIDHLLVAAEPIPGADGLDLRAHLLVGFAVVGDEATRLMLTAQQAAAVLGVPAALDPADVHCVAERTPQAGPQQDQLLARVVRGGDPQKR